MPKKQIMVTRRQVELARVKLAADIAVGKPVDPALRLIAEAGRGTSSAARAS